MDRKNIVCFGLLPQTPESKMNIDKFGHHVHKRLRHLEHIDGDINLQFSRLKGLRPPETEDEAANKIYVDQITKSLCTKQELNTEIKKLLFEIDSILAQFHQQFYTKLEINSILNKVSKNE